MHLPLSHRTSVLADVLDAWRHARMGAAVPHFSDILVEAERTGWTGASTMLFEVRAPAALVVLASSPALDAHLGFALQGADLLDMTKSVDRATRYGRFWHVTHRPCGLQVRDRKAPGPADGGFVETLCLPVRHGESGKVHVLAALPGVEGLKPRFQPVPIVEDAAWVDLGAGLPTSLYDMDPWLRNRPGRRT